MFNKFAHHVIKNAGKSRLEYHAGNFIPYYFHVNDRTVVTHDNMFFQVVHVAGFPYETSDDEDVDIRKTIRNQLFKGMASGSFAIYFHTIRRRQNPFSEGFADRKLHLFFADYVNAKWRNKHKTRKSFVNELYITVIRKPDTKGIAVVQHIIKKIIQKASKAAFEEDIKDTISDLSEMTNRVATSLRDYGARILGIENTPDGVISEVLTFLGKIVNCGFSQPILLANADISAYLPSQRLYFGDGVIEVTGSGGTKYAGIISLKEYGHKTSPDMLDVFLQLPHEFIITQSFQFTNRQVAITKMQLQQNRMIQAEDKAISQIAEITAALDDAMSGRIAFGDHHLTIMCYEDSFRSLDNVLSLFTVELSNSGDAVREKLNLEPAFWAQLPCNFNFIVRKGTISTLNLASFASQHNFHTGRKFGNHWGEALTVFNTTSGTPYCFNFHYNDIGHTAIIGPTGSGKTVLMNFLCAQSVKYAPRVFFFDKDRGAEIFIRALGGNYMVLESRTRSGFNPLQLQGTTEDRAFLMEWLRLLITTHCKEITSTDIAFISHAIEGNFKLKPQDRRLSNIVSFLGFSGPGSLSERIAMWYGDGSHAALFDNEEDNINFFSNSVFGFEMNNLLQDRYSLEPVLSYLFHRINQALDGTPTLIVLDEAWALIDNETFGPKIKDWLKILRKKNAMVIFATQSVEDASKSKISDTLIQQTATQIFLPNLKATDLYKTTFMLSDREYAIVKNTSPSSRFFLIKQGVSSVVAKLDLQGLEDVIHVLSGRQETVLLLDKIREKYGDNPQIWLPIFYEKVRHV